MGTDKLGADNAAARGIDANTLRLAAMGVRLRAGWQTIWQIGWISLKKAWSRRAWASDWAAQRAERQAKRRAARIRLVGSLSLGERRSVAVLEVEGRRFLVGATQQAVTLLAELRPDPLGFDSARERGNLPRGAGGKNAA